MRWRQWGPTPTPRSVTWTYIHYASKAHNIFSLKMKLVWIFRGVLDPGLFVGTWRKKWETMLTSVKISSPYADQANHSYCTRKCGLRKKNHSMWALTSQGAELTVHLTYKEIPELEGSQYLWPHCEKYVSWVGSFVEIRGLEVLKTWGLRDKSLWEKEQRQSGEKMQKQDVLFIC